MWIPCLKYGHQHNHFWSRVQYILITWPRSQSFITSLKKLLYTSNSLWNFLDDVQLIIQKKVLCAMTLKFCLAKISCKAQFTCLTYGSVNFHDQLYGRLESYGSVSTYGWMEISKCLLSKYTKKFSTST